MSHVGRDEITEFSGIARNVHRTKLPPKLFQTDAGGDRYELGSWRVRRGRRHTDVAAKASAITLLHGFELPDGSFGLLIVFGTTADGETNVAQQADS